MKSTGTLNNYLTNNLLSSRPGSAGTPYTYPLDAVGGAKAAYSVRKLSSAYAGPAIRVRRSSDNTEQDISFLGNDLDGASLSAFIGAGNGFVTTWYDQSGSGFNFTQTTAANQPAIVLNTTYNKYVIRFSAASSHFLTVGTLLGKPANFSFVSVFAVTNLTSGMYVYGSSINTGAQINTWGVVWMNRFTSSGWPTWMYGDGASNYAYNTVDSVLVANVFSTTSLRYASGVHDADFRKNGVLAGTKDANGFATTCAGTPYNFGIGRRGDFGASYFDGDMPEFIHHNIAWTDAQLKTIEDSQRDYFGF